MLSLKCTITAILLLMFFSCSLDVKYEELNAVLTERTRKEILINVSSDTLTVKLRGNIDSVGHKDLGYALDQVVISVLIDLNMHELSNLIVVKIYERNDDNRPIFVWTHDYESVLKTKLLENEFIGYSSRLERFCKMFTVRSLTSLDYICNTIAESGNYSVTNSGFLWFFWQSNILCITEKKEEAGKMQAFLLENADDSEFCPSCSKAILEDFFSFCEALP